MLSKEEQNDLRKRVLSGIPLTIDEARAVFETLRQGQATILIEGEKKPKKKSKKETAFSDAELDKDLADLGL